MKTATNRTADGIPVFCAHTAIVDVASLVPNPRNPNIHSERQVTLLAKVVDGNGWRLPIVVSKRSGMITKGHGRRLAAIAMGKTQVPIDEQDYADEAAEWADLLADNRIPELSERDDELVADLLAEIDLSGLDIELTGYDEKQARRIVSTLEHEIIEDAVPEPPADPTTKLGDVWLLGEHRLMCGDSTDPDAAIALMDGEVAQMMFTDPPWNVAIGSNRAPQFKRQGILNDDLSDEDFQAFLDGFVEAFMPHVTGDVYCVLGASEWPRLDATLRSHGMHWSATIIWVKDQFVLGRSKYHRRYEPIWYGWGKSGTSSFNDRRDLDDVWEIPRPKRSAEHPTMKPVELCARAIAASSTESVVDPFGGSGSTLMAAEQLGRRCFTMELDPAYCDVIRTRWEAATGREAVLERA